ncbi:MAG: AAA family ATPase [Gammaproteobacteria bacterium]|nr:AAA family ATPase [Gammaproteobacteria bacterium]
MKNPIKFLTIRGFKSIKKLDDFELGDLNVLIGSNGAGKSNFVSYFKMLGELVEARLQSWTMNQGSADRILSFGIKETSIMYSFIKFGANRYEFELEPTLNGEFIFSKEQAIFIGDSEKRIPFGAGHRESKLKAEFQKTEVSYPRILGYCYSAIASWKIYHFHDTSDTAGVKRLGSLHDNEYLRSDASNLAAYLYRLQQESPDVFAQICKTVRLALPFFDDFVLKPTKLKTEEEQIRLLWRQKNSDYALWPSQLSDGSIRFICLVTALLQPNPPSTLIIDEPELGLHPYAITLLGSLLRSASTRMQIIISTQSVPLLNEFSIEDLILVERKDGATTFNRCEKDEIATWLEDYTIGELWEKNILGGRPRK